MGLAKAMKAKYKLEKRKQGYVIARIKDQGVHIATQLRAGKLMRKFSANKVPTSIIMLVEQCVEGVQFNQVQLLYNEFLSNYREAQDQGKNFHYAWFLLSILLVVGRLPVDSQFPTIERNLPRAMRYTSL